MNAPNTRQFEALSGLRVLLTRARADNVELRGALEALGATVLELPAIERVEPNDWGPADGALQSLDRYTWIVFTSRYTVEAVFDRLRTTVGCDYFPLNLSVASVGPNTARTLMERGVRVDCTAAEASAEGLARDLIARGMEGERVLVPGGDLARPELRRALEQAGASVEHIVVYRTVKPREDNGDLEALKNGLVDVATLASPSAVYNLVDMLGGDARPLENIALVCIGPTTADAVRALGLSPAAVAEPHSSQGMAGAIIRLAGGERSNDKQ